MKLKLLFFLLIYNGYCFLQQIMIPDEYQKLKESPSNGKETKMKCFKMDTDSINDFAMIVQHKEEFNNYKILIYLSSLNKQFECQYIDNDWEFMIYPTPLEVKKNILTFGYYLDGTSAFGRFLKLRYNEEQKNIQVIGYDSGYRLPSGHVDKSYNLLTGKYIVIKRTSSTEKERVIKHQGNKRIKKIFLNDINNQLFGKLDEAGNEFEH